MSAEIKPIYKGPSFAEIAEHEREQRVARLCETLAEMYAIKHLRGK